MHTDIMYDSEDDNEGGYLMWEGRVDYDSVLADERNYFADDLDLAPLSWDDDLTDGEGEDEW